MNSPHAGVDVFRRFVRIHHAPRAARKASEAGPRLLLSRRRCTRPSATPSEGSKGEADRRGENETMVCSGAARRVPRGAEARASERIRWLGSPARIRASGCLDERLSAVEEAIEVSGENVGVTREWGGVETGSHATGGLRSGAKSFARWRPRASKGCRWCGRSERRVWAKAPSSRPDAGADSLQEIETEREFPAPAGSACARSGPDHGPFAPEKNSTRRGFGMRIQIVSLVPSM